MFAMKVAKARAKKATSSTSNSVRWHSALVAHRPGHGAAEQVLTLQRTVGNQAVQWLLAQRGSIGG